MSFIHEEINNELDTEFWLRLLKNNLKQLEVCRRQTFELTMRVLVLF